MEDAQEHVDECVQFGTPVEKQIEHYRQTVVQASQRKNVLEIKTKLQAHIQNPDYWTVLSRFIHGEIPKIKYDNAMKQYLRTNEAKILHNTFIKAIIFNAHFSSEAPPGVSVPRKHVHSKTPIHPRIAPIHFKTPEFPTYGSRELGRLPNVERIEKRIAAKNIGRTMKMNRDAATAVMASTRYYVMRILAACLSSGTRDWTASSSIRITSGHIAAAIEKDAGIGAFVAPSLLVKIPSH